MKLTWGACLKICVSVFALYLAIQFWPVISAFLLGLLRAATPLFVGCAIAYALNIPMSSFEKHLFPKRRGKVAEKLRRPVCMIAAFLALVGVVVLIVWLVVPQLVSCIQLIVDRVPGFIDGLVEKAEDLGVFAPETIGMLQKIDWPSKIGQIVSVVTSGLGSVAEVAVSVVTSVFSGVVTGLISVIFAVYLLLKKDVLKRQYHTLARRYVKQKWIDRIDYAAAIFNNCFHGFIVGQCTEAVILGGLCIVGMWILRLPYASMIGALIAFTALIPVAGAFIGGAVGAFMILTVSPLKALIFIVFLLILQQLEGNIIYPKVVGSTLGLPAIWVLAAVTIGGSVMGILGMLLGVPLTAAIYRMLRDDIHKNDPPQIAPEEEQPKEQQTKNRKI